jgi:hypothetical protein
MQTSVPAQAYPAALARRRPKEARKRMRPVVGETLETRDEYESNGQPVRERLSTAVLRVDDPAVRDNPYLADGLTKPKHRWIRVRVRLKQGSGTPTTVLTQQFAARSPSGQTFEAAGASMFDPAISGSSNAIELSAGRARMGFIAIQTPAGTRLEAIEFRDASFGPFPMFPDGHCPNEHRHDRHPAV